MEYPGEEDILKGIKEMYMSIPFIVYRLAIDPLLEPVRKAMIPLIEPDSSLIDFACGTGDFLMRLAPSCSKLCGIDLNDEAMRQAARRLKTGTHDHISFRHADGRSLFFIPDQHYDYASISLALHEMPEENRLPVLLEMKRTAGHQIIADYASPLPRNTAGRITRIIERLAGTGHYRGFCSYQEKGGLDPLLQEAGLEVIEESSALSGAVRLVSCRRKASVQNRKNPL